MTETPSRACLPAPDLATLAARLTKGFTRPDPDAIAEARARQACLTKPAGSLGRLEELALFMAGWQRSPRPQIRRAQALVFAGNHGICAQGVNPFPQTVTAQMVANFRAGGAAINQLCRASGAALSVIALDLDHPTGDFTEGPAMTEPELLDAMARGAAAVDPDADILILGEMGIGNSTVAAALAMGLFGGEARDWVGPGSGADDHGIARKARVIEQGMARHRKGAGAEDRTGNGEANGAENGEGTGEGLALLMAFGGREQAAICGAVLAAREARIPVILDGFICTAAAAVLVPHGPARDHGGSHDIGRDDGGSLAHVLAGHCSAEPGHRRLLAALGLDPILDLSMRLGEGSGAALALSILRAALLTHDGMATFDEAGVAHP